MNVEKAAVLLLNQDGTTTWVPIIPEHDESSVSFAADISTDVIDKTQPDDSYWHRGPGDQHAKVSLAGRIPKQRAVRVEFDWSQVGR